MKEKEIKKAKKNFRNYAKGRRSKYTVSAYENWIDHFVEWMNETDRSPEGDNLLSNYDNYLYRELDRPKNTRKVALSAAKLFLVKGFGVPKDDLMTVNNKELLGDNPSFDPRVYTTEEIDKIIDSACDEKERAMMELAYHCILRAKGVMELKNEQINLKKGTIKPPKVKESLSHELNLSDRIINIIEPFVDDSEYFYRNEFTDSQTMCSHFWVVHKVVRGEGTSFHSFARHSPICHRLAAGERFEDVWRRARHKHYSMTMRYAQFVDREEPERLERR